MSAIEKALRNADACCSLMAEEGYTPDVIIDFGLCDPIEVGIFRKHWPGVRLVGAEPLPYREYPEFQKVYEVVVTDDPVETITFYECQSRGKHSCSSLWPYPSHRKWRPKLVPTKTLDSIFAESVRHGEKLFLWVDVEGAEMKALRSGLQCLKSTDWLHIECTAKQMYIANRGESGERTCIEDLEPFILSQGFECALVSKKTIRTHDRTYRKVARK